MSFGSRGQRLPSVAESDGGGSSSSGSSPARGAPAKTIGRTPSGRFVRWANSIAANGNGSANHQQYPDEPQESPHSPHDAVDDGLRYRGAGGGGRAALHGAAAHGEAFPDDRQLHSQHAWAGGGGSGGGRGGGGRGGGGRGARPVPWQMHVSAPPQRRPLPGPKPLAQCVARAAHSLAAAALLLGSGVGGLVVAVCLYLTVRPWSRSVYRRMLCSYVTAPLVDAAALLLPRTRVCITGDSDMLDGLCPGAVVSNKLVAPEVAALDCWCVLLVARAVGAHGHTKVLIRQSLAQVPLVGWLLRLLEFPALGHSYQQHRDELRGALASFADDAVLSGVPYLFLHFPEGESFSKKSLASSLEFAWREGRPELRHLLLPHTTTLTAVMDGLRAANPVVYDVTVAAHGYGGRVPDDAPSDLLGLAALITGGGLLGGGGGVGADACGRGGSPSGSADGAAGGSSGAGGAGGMGTGAGCPCCGGVGTVSTPPPKGLGLGATVPAVPVPVVVPPPPGTMLPPPSPTLPAAVGGAGTAAVAGAPPLLSVGPPAPLAASATASSPARSAATSAGAVSTPGGGAGGAGGVVAAGAGGAGAALPSGWGRSVFEVHMRIKKYSLEEVLGNAHWLDDRWVEKERLLAHFAAHGSFPSGGRGFPARRSLDTHSPQFVGSVMAVLRLSVVPLALPFAMLMALPFVAGMACCALAWHAVSHVFRSVLRRVFGVGRYRSGGAGRLAAIRGGAATEGEGEDPYEAGGSPVSSRPNTPWWGGPTTPLNTPAPGAAPGGGAGVHYVLGRASTAGVPSARHGPGRGRGVGDLGVGSASALSGAGNGGGGAAPTTAPALAMNGVVNGGSRMNGTMDSPMNDATNGATNGAVNGPMNGDDGGSGGGGSRATAPNASVAAAVAGGGPDGD